MNTQEIHDVFTESQAGQLIFPEVVRRLLGAGVESYFCDLAGAQERFYATDGATHDVPMKLRPDAVAADFSANGVVAAIRGAQADTIRYPEFVRQIAGAGVIAYWAFLTGRKVIYFGRKGEMHVEEFPGQKK
jgi:uncharacterized protein YbcV (DUF1398 family)